MSTVRETGMRLVTALKTELKLQELTEENDILVSKFYEGKDFDEIICSHAGKTYSVVQRRDTQNITVKQVTQ